MLSMHEGKTEGEVGRVVPQVEGPRGAVMLDDEK